jgi:hypothetical protein
VSDTDLDRQMATLKSSLDQTIVLLRAHGEHQWLSWAERCQRELDANDSAAFDHVLGAFGGMGSFNDLLILGWNGHLIEPEREAAVNDRLAHLRTAIWTSAKALRRATRECPVPDSRAHGSLLWRWLSRGGHLREAFDGAPVLVGVNVVRPVGRSTLTPPTRRRGWRLFPEPGGW